MSLTNASTGLRIRAIFRNIIIISRYVYYLPPIRIGLARFMPKQVVCQALQVSKYMYYHARISEELARNLIGKIRAMLY